MATVLSYPRWFLAVRWLGHPYHWPRLGQTSKHHTQPPILLGGGGGSALVKWLALPLAGSFFFFQTQQKEANQKNKIKTQPIFSDVDHCHCRLEELWFCSLSDQRGARKRRSTFCFFFLFPATGWHFFGANSRMAGCCAARRGVRGLLEGSKGDLDLTDSICLKKKRKKHLEDSSNTI